MNRMRNLIGTALALFLGGVAQGRTNVPIVNPGFEQPALNACGFGGPATGWTVIGDSGPWRCGSGGSCLNSYPGGPPGGLQVAYANSGNLSQVLTTTLQPLQTHTLTVKVGRRLDCCQMAGYKVQLHAGAILLAEDVNSQNPAPGTWATSTVVYTAPANHPALGQPLKITLSFNVGGQANFDNVSLQTGAGTPCPADIVPAGGNGSVNIDDLLSVINNWGPCAAPCAADIAPVGGNGAVNIDDLLAVINAWGACP
jgi:hypothetical protein